MTVVIPETGQLDEAQIRAAEVRLGCVLPDSYRAFVAKHDGAKPAPNCFRTSQNESEVVRFVRVSEAASLRESIEGFPKKAIPIAEDSCGNYVWLDQETGAIYFWDHEVDEVSEKVSESFETFLTILQPFDPSSVRLKPGQVKRVWVNPDFKPKFD